MLQSQRDTTRLCSKYIEPRQAKPFSSYSQDELRFRMMQLDGCNGKSPAEPQPKKLGSLKADEIAIVNARRDLLLSAINDSDGLTIAQIRPMFPDMTQTQIANDLKGMKRAGRVGRLALI